MKKILVFAAHPDDEVLGCGATLAKYVKQKCEILVVFFTDGVNARENQPKKNVIDRKKNAKLCLQILGIKNFKNYELLDNQLDKYPLLQIVKIIEKEVNLFKPNTIYTHFNNDLNIDHQIVSRAVSTATRLNSKIENIFQFEVLSSTELNNLNSSVNFTPNTFENIKDYIDIKLKAFSSYKNEIKKWPHPRSKEGLKTLAKYRGMQSGQDYAEAFIQIRRFIK